MVSIGIWVWQHWTCFGTVVVGFAVARFSLAVGHQNFHRLLRQLQNGFKKTETGCGYFHGGRNGDNSRHDYSNACTQLYN